MENAASWNGNWAWSLPLIVLNVTFHVIGLGFINVKLIRVLTVAKESRYFVYVFALIMGITAILSDRVAWNRGRHLGGGLSGARSASGQQVGAALLAKRNDDLRSFGNLPCRALAPDGCSGSVKRAHPLWTDHRLYVRHDPAGLAARETRVERAAVAMVEAPKRVVINFRQNPLRSWTLPAGARRTDMRAR